MHAAERPGSRATSTKTWLAAGAGLLTLAMAGVMMAFGAPAHAKTEPEGSLVSATMLQRLSAASVRTELASARAEPGGPVLGSAQVRDGIVAYRVSYQTADANGHPVLASGLVVFPTRGTTLRLVSYDHGTTATRADVPSLFGLGRDHAVEGRWSAELFASAGFAVAEPDYVGMGSGAGPIQYLVAKSETSASADLLTAARTLAARHGITLDPGVDVTGFSQGGAAAMALGRDLQSHRGYFRLAALAPVSGPYDLPGAEVPAVFNGQLNPAISSYYVGFTLVSWNQVYHLYSAPGQAFRAPYAAEVTGLFDGGHQDEQIIAALPPTIGKLLTPKFLNLLRHPSGAFLAALRANSTCGGWTPDVPIRLYAARGDTTVTQVNAEHCAAATGATLVRLGQVDHNTSDIVALPQIARWFAQPSLAASRPR